MIDIKKVKEDLENEQAISGTRGLVILKSVAIEKAKFALLELDRLQQKEKPMKVDSKTRSDFDDWWDCPKCKGVLKQGDKYCSQCGVKLDWSDEK